MKIFSTQINNLVLLEPQVYGDSRGIFYESFNSETLGKLGIYDKFVQDNHIVSSKGVLRGVHVQKYYPQAKIMRVLKGRIWDVVVDLRKDSQSFGRWLAFELSSENRLQLYIPENFAHGFFTMEEGTEILMKVTSHYHPNDEIGFMWNDPEINIDWPLQGFGDVILAEKDTRWGSFKELRHFMTNL